MNDGSIVLDLELSPKRMINFKSFELEKYNKAISIVDKRMLTGIKRLNEIDKLLFKR